MGDDDRGRRGLPFRGTEAVAQGILTTHDLRVRCTRRMQDVHQVRGAGYGPDEHLRAAWSWAPEGSVVAGLGAARLHGERMLADDRVLKAGLDLYVPTRSRAPRGVRLRIRNRHLRPEHVVTVDGIDCTSIARTAADLGRWRRDPVESVVAVDALCRATGIPPAHLEPELKRMRPIHGLARVLELLPLCDHRADSPPETRLRLAIRFSPLPDPEPQVAIRDGHGRHVATADLGYRRARVALFYDGEVHLQREQRDWDANVTARLTELGWRSLRITAGMLRAEPVLLRRIADLLARQGHPPTSLR